mmetsp:Transcript_21814/g.38879  ORF Transcript_21814/g.38879 Transcript_21814/m.38879 type:complete len:216 (-) Transcript_21814:402-1049(-)
MILQPVLIIEADHALIRRPTSIQEINGRHPMLQHELTLFTPFCGVSPKASLLDEAHVVYVVQHLFSRGNVACYKSTKHANPGLPSGISQERLKLEDEAVCVVRIPQRVLQRISSLGPTEEKLREGKYLETFGILVSISFGFFQGNPHDPHASCKVLSEVWDANISVILSLASPLVWSSVHQERNVLHALKFYIRLVSVRRVEPEKWACSRRRHAS